MPEENKISKAQQKAVNKYVKNNYDRINVTFPKGKKEILKDYAEKHGESVNSFIVRAVNETMERDASSPAAKSSELQILTENVTEPSQNVPISSKKQRTQHKPFTEADASRINFTELLINVRYQLDIWETFGKDVLDSLMKKARQQEAEKETVSNQ